MSDSKEKTVLLSTLKAGDKFKTSSGRKGQLLRNASTTSAYCRLWFTEKEMTRRTEDGMKAKAYEDIPIAPSTQVVPLA